MHEYAERGIASHWKYKSSEKFNSLTWKEYDWLADLVEIIDKNENPEHSYEYTKLQMFQENVFCFTPKGSVIKLPKDATPIDFAYAVHTKVGNSAIGCKINGNDVNYKVYFIMVMLLILLLPKINPLLCTGYLLQKLEKLGQQLESIGIKEGEEKAQRVKKYNTTLWISLPDKPGKLGAGYNVAW